MDVGKMTQSEQGNFINTLERYMSLAIRGWVHFNPNAKGVNAWFYVGGKRYTARIERSDNEVD